MASSPKLLLHSVPWVSHAPRLGSGSARDDVASATRMVARLPPMSVLPVFILGGTVPREDVRYASRAGGRRAAMATAAATVAAAVMVKGVVYPPETSSSQPTAKGPTPLPL